MASSDAPYPAGSGSLDLPPSLAQRTRRGSVAMTINLIVAAVILGGGSIVEAVINSNTDRGWLIYFGVIPAALMVVLGLQLLRIRHVVVGDTLDLDAANQLRPLLRRAWIAAVVSALAVIVLLLVFDFLASGGKSGGAIIGALPPFLCAVVANTSYGAAKNWLNPKLD